MPTISKRHWRYNAKADCWEKMENGKGGEPPYTCPICKIDLGDFFNGKCILKNVVNTRYWERKHYCGTLLRCIGDSHYIGLDRNYK